MAMLFVHQVLIYSDEREARVREQARADKLQLIIDQNQVDSGPRTLSVNSANKSELVQIANIAYCKGAPALLTGNKVLHSDSPNQLEQFLPPIFLRAHRSDMSTPHDPVTAADHFCDWYLDHCEAR